MQKENLPAVQQGRSLSIKNLCPGLPEVGKIKIGKKGDQRQGRNGSFQLPTKVDHFIITTLEKGADDNFIPDARMIEAFGETPREIPVKLLYDSVELNFPTRYVCYFGKTLFCSGDGETAQRLKQDKTREQVACPCHRQAPDFEGDDGKGKGKCKINGVLSALIDGANSVGGVWKFRTTSYNSVVGLLSSMALIKRITCGPLAGIALMLTIRPKSTTTPQGSQQTVYVVGLEFRGSMEALQDTGYQIAVTAAKHGLRIEHIEAEARQLLTYDAETVDGLGDGSSAEEIAEEFYPAEAAEAEGKPLAGEPPPLAKPGAVIEAEPADEPDTPPALERPQKARGKKPKQEPKQEEGQAPAEASPTEKAKAPARGLELF